MIFMGFVLGWRWVGLRLVVGLLLVFVVAYLVQWLVRDDRLIGAAPAISGGSGAGPKEVTPSTAIWTRWLRELWRLSIGLIPEYLVLVLLLGASRAWLFPAVTPSA